MPIDQKLAKQIERRRAAVEKLEQKIAAMKDEAARLRREMHMLEGAMLGASKIPEVMRRQVEPMARSIRAIEKNLKRS